MTMRDLLTVDHPCLFCEAPITVSVLRRDDETGAEEWSHETLEHECASLAQVRRERVKMTYKSNSAMRGYGD